MLSLNLIGAAAAASGPVCGNKGSASGLGSSAGRSAAGTAAASPPGCRRAPPSRWAPACQRRPVLVRGHRSGRPVFSSMETADGVRSRRGGHHQRVDETYRRGDPASRAATTAARPTQ